jgi:hypothetical protein
MSVDYNRTVPLEFSEQLKRGGNFDPLVRFAMEEPLLDLQFRGDPNRDPRVTLYYGLTALLHIFGQRKPTPSDPVFKVEPHKGREARARLPLPRKWLTPDEIGKRWEDIEVYLRQLMSEMNKRWTRGEGAVPSSLKATRLISVIDSEVVLHYSTTAERKEIKAEVVERYLKALTSRPNHESFGKIPPFGNELDVLSVDVTGRLLLIELKQASSTSGITWAPAQVSVYVDLFQKWVDRNETAAHGTLTRMLEQRRRLRLAGGGDWKIAFPLRLVPVVGIGGDVRSKVALSRLRTVQETLINAGVGHKDLEIWQFGAVNIKRWQDLIGA